ncbi:uracil-DNA glycosylase [Mariniblastus fucicola]|uniref:Type-4 uracil-DNA glycosylase n=1 Tax=Mariniblastus fucicola TaxID=980251 RepID=A0A5B9P717_9BACT|nr:uracil-DNA glycosylase [Mariniblastus fucicola]QEG20730.1 Uracil DNA glycosylase superfamily protein [Mariniblastus fucicola]
MDPEQTEIDLQKLLQQQLHSLAQFGVREIAAGNGDVAFQFVSAATESQPDSDTDPAEGSEAKTLPHATTSATAAMTVKESRPVAVSPAAVPKQKVVSENWGPATDVADRPAALEVINAEVRGCTQCEELCAHRTQTVFGVGNPAARLVFVGEGPGADEDRQGEPFVGAAGKLLNKILAASKLKREDVYILNTVKCRPPRNRNPTETEIRSCWGYADRQLEVIQPEFICCLGSVAAKTMLQTTQSLGRLRGRFHPWKGAKLMVTYHPAYLLRNEGAKRHVWEDMKMLVKEMGIELSN